MHTNIPVSSHLNQAANLGCGARIWIFELHTNFIRTATMHYGCTNTVSL